MRRQPLSTPGQRIRERRLALHIMQTELADRAGISRSTILELESDRAGKLIGGMLAYKIAKVLGWRIEDILGVPKLNPWEDDDDVPAPEEIGR